MLAPVFPLSSTLEFTPAAELALPLLLGLGFGFALERAGFGSARKLTAVFYLWDMAVVKVMLTAIVTAMAGLALLAAIGTLDLGALYVEPTNFAAAAMGGLIFGAGFIVGGYCPGTAIAASALGRRDAWLFALGMLAGVWVYASFTPGLDDWIRAGQVGELTLPGLSGLGMGAWALGFLALLVALAFGLGVIERRFAHWRPPA
jgi:hypothetical protein